MKKDYPEYRKFLLAQMGKMQNELSAPMSGFANLNKECLTDSALSKKTKELIALGIAIAIRCEGCLAFHVAAALKAGNSRPEILDTIGVAILMGGGPSMVYACEAFAALEQFEAQ